MSCASISFFLYLLTLRMQEEYRVCNDKPREEVHCKSRLALQQRYGLYPQMDLLTLLGG